MYLMKKSLLNFCIIILFACSANTVKAQDTLIHYWDFNNTSIGAVYMPTVATIKSAFSLIDTNKAYFQYQPLQGTTGNANSYVDFLTPGDTTNCMNGSPIGSCLRLRNPYDSMQGVFYIPSTNHKNIIVSFATERSGSGPQIQHYSYSLDSGMTWLTSGLSIVQDSILALASPFQLVTIGFSPDANNNPKLAFRILQSDGVTANGGNNRYDNFAVQSSPTVNSVTKLSNSISSCLLFPNPANNTVNFLLPYTGVKTITIINAAGQTVNTFSTSDNQYAANIATLSTGLYFANIKIANKSVSLKFNKN